MFHVSPLVVSVDGPDGSGKTTFVKFLAEHLRRNIPELEVDVIVPNSFDGCTQASNIGRDLNTLRDQVPIHSESHNSYFLEAYRANYEALVIPAISAGRIAIIDSSEIRSLAFIIDVGSEDARKDTIHKIKLGYLNFSIVPKTRIVFDGSIFQIQSNLDTRHCLDTGDPRTPEGIRRRIASYSKAITIIRNLPTSDNIDWVEIKVNHSHNVENHCLSLIRSHNLVHKISDCLSVAGLSSSKIVDLLQN